MHGKERKHEKENDYPVYTCAAGSGVDCSRHMVLSLHETVLHHGSGGAYGATGRRQYGQYPCGDRIQDHYGRRVQK